ncbi:NADP-dependent malic enzyme [Candidatus Uhrbacteria bacterium]|nr:MAG: NADP-dependent malic enzyme [Candidatus Uhrbacteria bacterium]
MAQDVKRLALELHEKLRGKIRIEPTCTIETKEDLTLVYSPGVGAVSQAIAADPASVDRYTWRRNTVAIVSDGSAVLGFGDIGHLSVLPVLEGKSAIFKRFSGIDAIPILIDTKDVDAFVETVAHIASSFGAIQMEDVSAPRCFEIERKLMERLDMPVMHDDQHGTAIVALAGLMNSLKVVGKSMESIRVVLNGAGAAGIAIARLLVDAGVKDIVMCDRQGAIYDGREGLNDEKKEVAAFTNLNKRTGSLSEVAVGADVLIGVSAAGAFTVEIVKSMATSPIVFALANPVPEIDPETAALAGVAVLATGRSDFANQVNNALCYPGLFRGMLDSGVKKVTSEIKLRAAQAIADSLPNPTPDAIIPSIFQPGLHELVAKSIKG